MIMSDAERHLAKQFHLEPQEAHILDQLREAVGYLPREVVHSDGDTAMVFVSKLRYKLRASRIGIRSIIDAKILRGKRRVVGYRLVEV